MNTSTEKEWGQIAWRWWHGLVDPEHGDRGALARLRRCQGPTDALVVPQALTLVRRLGLDGERRLDALGLAIVLAHVRESDGLPLMRAAGWQSFPGDRRESEVGAERPLLSEPRFRRLLQTTPDERIAAFVRLVRLLGGKANVNDLAASFLAWGDRVRQRWAFDYYAAGRSAPAASADAEGAEA